MTLFIQTDVNGDGSGDTVHPANASTDLIAISNMDTGYGENAGQPVADLNQVTYAQTTTGPCPDRLSALVNTNFNVNAQNVDIIILAVGFNFVLDDGTLMAGNGTSRPPIQIIPIWSAGTAFSRGDLARSGGNVYTALNDGTSGTTAPSGTSASVSDGAINWTFFFSGNGGNPTQSVLVFYDISDNNGNGSCEKGLASGNYDLSSPSPVTLYHELSHAFNQANLTPLSLLFPDPTNICVAQPEEQRAETDENDMRTQMNQPLRDTSDHCSNPGMGGSCAAPSCCIVASVATGSPYSDLVNSLRQVRDGVLRSSEVGFDFFSKLHEDYYAFSPEVCRMMGASQALTEGVRTRFVAPLTLGLGLMRAHMIGGRGPDHLGDQFDRAVAKSPDLAALTAGDLRAARSLLAWPLSQRFGDLEPEFARLAELLDERARPSPYVRWALYDPILLVVDALEWLIFGMAPAEIGQRLAPALDAWAARMPLTDIWHRLSQYALDEEISFLGTALFRGAGARAGFRARVLDHVDGAKRDDLEAIFDRAWGGAEAHGGSEEVTP